ncbi:CubicO group peptidase, beta-lactamase class C family [Zhouia amylolytica]|uniref:CubicO group peptidase, beta-lactamase class C family n=1 Tax=Zhouia amylolytica TaxID=376730 RepID=A0A1I6PIB8_9FLAO|nr:serine hydrolase [Zhouia amylolytica]MCQ0111500.1 serine hydrolase [Zhouia amylolytica]SFS39903.1 CubicO group peptidase, beta-lactamase class C family [Zhouia amylolytica]
MKVFRLFLKWILIPFGLIIMLLYLFDYDYLIKAVRTIYLNGQTTAYLDDYKVFDNRTIASAKPQPWPKHIAYNTTPATDSLNKLHEKYSSVAFLVIKDDSLWHETYFDGYDKDSKSNSFSMAKSMVSAMLGRAIMDGKIKSLEQPVGDFYPEFSMGLASKMTVGDLSSMSSGLNWDEAYYSPFSITTRAYFDENLRDVILNLKVVEEPGQYFKYLSGNTQLLGMILEKATGQTLADYLSEKFWKPIGAENEAYWQLDSEEDGLEKAYCCIASNARDFARFGKLYKDFGKWNGQQILDSSFVVKSITPRFENDWMYGYGFWLLPYKGKNFFMLRGHLGQYVIVEPNDNLIIVRLGHERAEKKPDDPFRDDIYGYIDETYKMLK